MLTSKYDNPLIYKEIKLLVLFKLYKSRQMVN